MKQQEQPYVQGITDGVKTVSYSVNTQGEYELVPGLGWQPVNIVNRQAWQEIEKNIASSMEKVSAGRVSYLHYYMTANQMDIGLLAKYTNQSRLRVRLHLVPYIFRRLHPDTLKKYAELFKVAPQELTCGKLNAPIDKQNQHAE